MDRPGYYSGCGSGGGAAGAYEQSAPPQHAYYGGPPPDMQQCYQPVQPPPGYLPFPNDPYALWTQQTTAWMAQMAEQSSGSYVPPPPPPPPAVLLLGRPTKQMKPPPPPNMDAIFGEEDVRKEPAPAAPAPAARTSPTASAVGASSSPSNSTTSSSTTRIPSLLEGLRADVAARDAAADLKSIEHAASILSIRTGKTPARSRRENRSSSHDRRGYSSRRAEERSDSRKENRVTTSSSRDHRRDVDRRRGEERDRERSRSRHRSRSPRDSSRHEKTDEQQRRWKERNGEKRERRRERREARREKEQDTSITVDDTPVRPADIRLDVRESARSEGGVQVYLHSDDEHDEGEAEDDYYDDDEEEEGDGGEEQEAAAESDMDIQAEDDDEYSPESSFSLQQQQQQLNDSYWPVGCAPEDEEEHRTTPKLFFSSGVSRRVNNPIYRESYKRARALASLSLSQEYRERYDLISKLLRSRCIFKGLESSCGPEAPKLTISDPRPKSKYVQTFPSKESNVQYHGPDTFVAPGAFKKVASSSAIAPPGSFTYVSRLKLVRAPATTTTVSSSTGASGGSLSSLKRTIHNEPPAKTTQTLTSSSSASTLSLASTVSDSAGPPPAKLSRVDEVMDRLLARSAPHSPSARSTPPADEAALPPRADEDTPASAASMRKVASEPRIDAVVPAAVEAPLPAAASLPAIAARSAAATPHAERAALPPRSALSFRKIGEHVVRPGSKLCYEWAESGACKSGVFCHFEHGEGAEKAEKKVCSRMLRGLCRGDGGCPLPHGLLPHQMPICEHYLRLQCKFGPEQCGLVHIKHNEKVPVCVFFNQGKCTKDDDCTFRHQYRSDVVRALGVHAPPPQPGQPRGLRTDRLPKGRALLTAAPAAAAAAAGRPSSATASPARSPAAAAAAEQDTSTFAWIM